MKFHRPRIQRALLLVNLVIFLLPLGGIGAFRLYETELIRQTEASLIAQAVFIRELYARAFAEALHEEPSGTSFEGLPKVAPAWRDVNRIRLGEFRELYPKIDVREATKRPPIIEDVSITGPVEPASARAGRAIEPLLRNAQHNLLSGIRVVNADGIVVASTSGRTGYTLKGREEVERALLGEPVTLVRERSIDYSLPEHSIVSFGTASILFYALPIVEKNHVLGAVVLSRTPLNLANAIYRHRVALYWYFALLIVIIVIVTFVTARMITRPIRQLIRQARLVQSGMTSAAVPLTRAGTFEVAELSQAITAMARTLDERSVYIRDFASRISHEFKTPIASIQGSVEILADHLGSLTADEQTRFLTMIQKDAKRMERLVTRLLELARLEAVTESQDRVAFIPVLDEVVDRFAAKGLEIKVDADRAAASVEVPMSHDSLYSCLANVIENSWHHGGSDVTVILHAAILAGETEPMLAVTVTDDGPGIHAKDRPRILEPFYTTARERGGTGLGLSIVQATLRAARGRIELPPVERGTVVRLVVPVL